MQRNESMKWAKEMKQIKRAKMKEWNVMCGLFCSFSLPLVYNEWKNERKRETSGMKRERLVVVVPLHLN